MLTKILAGSVFATALLIGGCSSDDSGSKAPTKDEYITEADEVCTDWDKKVDALGEPEFTDAGIEKFADEISQSLRDLTTDLRKITPPTADADKLNSGYDAVDDWADELDSVTTFDEFSASVDPKGVEDLENYGFKVCFKDDESMG
ncbi:hypothetical protein [Antrihabitans sp. YC2-6]|uniref:hypothetical protein n=1 Tax=Antrihabitans sp. YC2-6 TaxID=2799498 RepID=UPI0018F3F45F|nr:hypothetical protein [Antrihabitans sp. YC2-6]MBJ8348414.1 hypothetical protein [Antrihabitans sp. YC2-6]